MLCTVRAVRASINSPLRHIVIVYGGGSSLMNGCPVSLINLIERARRFAYGEDWCKINHTPEILSRCLPLAVAATLLSKQTLQRGETPRLQFIGDCQSQARLSLLERDIHSAQDATPTGTAQYFVFNWVAGNAHVKTVLIVFWVIRSRPGPACATVRVRLPRAWARRL